MSRRHHVEMDDVEVVDERENGRFVARVDGVVSELVYRKPGKRLVLVHTEVPEELAGRGIGGRLVQAATKRAASEGLTLVPLCPFARRWLEQHPDAASTVTIDWG